MEAYNKSIAFVRFSAPAEREGHEEQGNPFKSFRTVRTGLRTNTGPYVTILELLSMARRYGSELRPNEQKPEKTPKTARKTRLEKRPTIAHL